MEPRKASSAFPLAIRARLSTEDSGSDASSFDSSGRDESEEEDNGGSFRRSFVPIARVTGEEEDDDDDVVDELVFGDGEWGKTRLGDESFGVGGSVVVVEEMGYGEEVERMGVSVDGDDEWGNRRLADERLVAERSNSAVDESFGVGASVIVVEEKGYVEEEERMVVLGDDDDEWGDSKLAAERLVVERLNSVVDESFGGRGSVVVVEEMGYGEEVERMADLGDDDDEWGNSKLAAERLVVERSNSVVDEGFSGRGEEDGDVGVNGSVIVVEEKMDVLIDDDEWGNPRFAEERLVVERSNSAVDESFGGGGFSGREEKDDDMVVKGSVIVVEEKGYVEKVERMVVLGDDDDEWGNFKLVEERLVVERSNSAVDESFCSGVFSGREEKDDDMSVKGSAIVVEERVAVSIDDDEWGNPKLAVERLVVERSNSVVDESFCSGVFAGKEEKDDDMSVKGSVIVLDDDAGAVEVGLGLNDVKVEVDGSNLVHDVEEDLDSGAVVYEEIGAVRCRDVELFELSTVDSEKNNLDGDVDSTQNSAMEVEMRAEFEAGHLVIPEVEDNSSEIVKVEDFGAVTSRKRLNEDAEEEIGVFGDKEEEVSGLIYSKIGFFGEKMLEASEAEANSTESKRFEATKLKLIHDSKAFELEYPEVSAIYMEAGKDEDLYRSVDSVDSEKPKHFTGELLVLTDSLNVQGNDSPSTVVSTETTMVYLDNVNEKNDESRAEEISIAENYSNGEFSSDNFSPFYVCEKEMESRFDSFYFSLDEDSVEEDEHVIPEYISENSGFVKHILKEMEEDLSSLQTSSHILDGETISNSDQEEETYKYSDAKELLDTCALAALLRDSYGGSSGKVALFTSQDTSSVNDMDDEEMMLCSRVEQLRAKYLRLLEKLGHSTDDALPNHVLRQIGLIDLVRRGRRISEDFNLKTAKKVIFQHDEGKHDFIFSCTVLVLGKTGVGKSAIINSIFGEERAFTDPFQPATTSVREISGQVDGVSIRFIDTPGLLTSLNDQRSNRNILSSIKKCIRRCPPDIVLYVDRLDAYNQDFNELPMLRMITNILGSSIWLNAIVALTHADSAIPDGPDGSSMSYDNVVVQRSKVIQQLICQAAEDSRLVNLVALVENHSSCRKDMDGESILTNGLRWRPWLLLLWHSFKVLSEVYSLMKHEIHSPQKLFPFHSLYPSPVFLSSNSSTYLGGDMDLDNLADRPPSFKPPASKSRARKLTEERKNAFLIRAGKRSGRRKSSED